MKKIPHQKVVLYGCLITENENVPVLDFLSSTHTSEAITYILELFNRDAKKVNHENNVQPLYVVTGFLYALIHVLLQQMYTGTLPGLYDASLQMKETETSIVSIHCFIVSRPVVKHSL